MTTLTDLIKMDEKDRKKLSKDELLTTIKTYGFQYTQALEREKSAKEDLVTQSKNEEAAKAILVGYLDLPTERKNDYGGTDTIEYNLLDLVGKVLANQKSVSYNLPVSRWDEFGKPPYTVT